MNQKKQKNYLLFISCMAHRIPLAIHGYSHFSIPPAMFWFEVFQGKSALKKSLL